MTWFQEASTGLKERPQTADVPHGLNRTYRLNQTFRFFASQSRRRGNTRALSITSVRDIKDG
ncbi:MAG: hypothetical protein ACLQJ0_23505 [Steroidobacteraceae bacterium]